MMDKKKGFGEELEAFFAGKGFYIVLFLCVAVIGTCAWVMLTENKAYAEPNDVISVMEEAPEEKQGSIANEIEVSLIVPEEKEPENEVQEVAEPVFEPAVQTSVQAKPQIVNDFYVSPVNGEIENPYSMVALIYDRTMRDWRTHDGIDICAELGEQVKAVTGGKVEKIYNDDMLGTSVVINHGNGIVSCYSNLAETPTVSVGDIVSPGQVIGSVGNTSLGESAEVCHLHLSMARDGQSIDPGELLP